MGNVDPNLVRALYEEEGLSVFELIDYLHVSYGIDVSKRSLERWLKENGISKPKIDDAALDIVIRVRQQFGLCKYTIW